LCQEPDNGISCTYPHEHVHLELSQWNLLNIQFSSRFHLPELQEADSSLEVRRFFDDVHEAGARYLGPQARLGDSTYMIVFDPNECTCITYLGTDLVQMPLGAACEYRCRHKQLESGHTRKLMRGPHFGNFTRSGGNIKHSYFAGNCNGRDQGCRKQDFECRTSITLESLESLNKENMHKVDPVWFRAVNPESYGMIEDFESRHILWCPDARCRNYHANAEVNRFWGWKAR
jgi:hypothetical protein